MKPTRRKDIEALRNTYYGRNAVRFFTQNNILFEEHEKRGTNSGYLVAITRNDLMHYEGLASKLEEDFEISFPHVSFVLCKCGSKKFEASYGEYSLNLTCTSCKNHFSAYSG